MLRGLGLAWSGAICSPKPLAIISSCLIHSNRLVLTTSPTLPSLPPSLPFSSFSLTLLCTHSFLPSISKPAEPRQITTGATNWGDGYFGKETFLLWPRCGQGWPNPTQPAICAGITPPFPITHTYTLHPNLSFSPTNTPLFFPSSLVMPSLMGLTRARVRMPYS